MLSHSSLNRYAISNMPLIDSPVDCYVVLYVSFLACIAVCIAMQYQGTFRTMIFMVWCVDHIPAQQFEPICGTTLM
jgi:hypothetical protein